MASVFSIYFHFSIFKSVLALYMSLSTKLGQNLSGRFGLWPSFPKKHCIKNFLRKKSFYKALYFFENIDWSLIDVLGSC